MTLNFFSQKPKDDNAKKYRAENIVRTFLWGRPHLPKDFVQALKTLIPGLYKEDDELKQDEFEE